MRWKIVVETKVSGEAGQLPPRLLFSRTFTQTRSRHDKDRLSSNVFFMLSLGGSPRNSSRTCLSQWEVQLWRYAGFTPNINNDSHPRTRVKLAWVKTYSTHLINRKPSEATKKLGNVEGRYAFQCEVWRRRSHSLTQSIFSAEWLSETYNFHMWDVRKNTFNVCCLLHGQKFLDGIADEILCRFAGLVE